MPFSVKMDSIVTRIAVLTTVLIVTGCAEDRPELSGRLYFAAGSYLAELDLRRLDTNVITSLGDDTLIELAPHGDARLLLNVIGKVNRYDVQQLVLFDIESKQLLPFFAGRKGRYLVDSDVLVYDDGRQILAKRRYNGNWETIEIASHPLRETVRIVPVSATALLYSIGSGPPQQYDVASGEPAVTPGLAEQCSLDAAIWVPGIDALLCRLLDSPLEYAFVSLDGEIRETLSLPAGRPLRAVAYAADQDIVILTEEWQSFVGERSKFAVWVHHRDTGRTYRLIENQHLGETVVYRP